MKSPRIILFCILLLAVIHAREKKPSVSLLVFCADTAKSCTFVRELVEDELGKKFAGQLQVRYYNTDQDSSSRYFDRLQVIYNDRYNHLPAVFLNDRFIPGRMNIKKKLKFRINRILLAGGSPWPDTTARKKVKPRRLKNGTAHIAMFFSPDCGYCSDVKKNFLPLVQRNYPNRLKIEFVDIETPKGNAYARHLEKKAEEMGNYLPFIYADGRFLSGKTEIALKLDWWVSQIISRGGCQLPARPGKK